MARRESVLVVGGPQTGKSVFLMQTAVKNPDQPVWAFDNERKLEAVAEFFGGVPENMTIVRSPKLSDAIDYYEGSIQPELAGKPEGYGIIMVDMIEKWWERSQQFYVEKVSHGEEHLADRMTEFASLRLEEMRRRREQTGDNSIKMKSGNPLEGFVEWPIVKQWHTGRLLEPMMYESPAHFFATAGVREIRREGNFADSQKRQEIWSEYGAIALGEKDNDYRFITMLGIWRSGLQNPEYSLTLVKDMSRQLGKPVKKFLGVRMEPDDEGVFDLWEEYCLRVPGAPKVLSVPSGVSS